MNDPEIVAGVMEGNRNALKVDYAGFWIYGILTVSVFLLAFIIFKAAQFAARPRYARLPARPHHLFSMIIDRIPYEWFD